MIFFNTDVPPVVVKDNAYAGGFVTAFNNLKPHGGGDCPEYTFTGMLEVLYKEPQWSSPCTFSLMLI